MRAIRPLFIALSTVILAASFAGCRKAAESTAEAGGFDAISVTIETARVQSLRATASGPGLVVPSASGDWVIHAQELGRVAQMLKREGDAVTAGEVLVKFEYGSTNADAMAHEAEISAANTRLEAAKQQQARVQGMVDRGFASKVELDTAKSAVAAIELEVTRHQRQLEAAHLEAERAVVKARFNGVVAKVFHHDGDLVNASGTDPVMRIIDPALLEALVSVPVDQAAQVQPGQTATIISLNGAEPATVLARPPATDPKAVTQEIRLSFLTPTTLAIDSPIQAEVLLAERVGVITLPVAAVRKTADGGSFVMVADENSYARRREVRTGLTAQDRVEILTGVNPGDQVITKSTTDVAEGTAVVPDR